jgi:hypothetical protein
MSTRQDLINEIIGYRLLEEDWDGEGAIKLKEECILEALQFLEEIPYEFPLPDVCADPNGKVLFYWNEEETGFRAYVDILGDGRIAYFMVEGDVRHKGITNMPGKKDGRDADRKTKKKGKNS